MENYFNIRYEFDKRAVLQAIDEALLLGKPGYICVSDGVILSTVNRDPDYRQVVDGAMFSICDSGYVIKTRILFQPITYIIKPFIHRIFRMVIGYCCSFKVGNLPPPQSIIA